MRLRIVQMTGRFLSLQTRHLFYFSLFIGLVSAGPDLVAGTTDRNSSDPMEPHRKLALTVNKETRTYALLHNPRLVELIQEWEKTKPRSGHLRDYLKAHDPGFKELMTRWPERYSDKKLASLILWTAEQSALLKAFGFSMSDDELLGHFNAHRTEFEALRAMLEEDRAKGLKLIGIDKTEPPALAEIGIPPERVAEYRKKMGAAKLTLVSITPDPEFYYNGHYFVWLAAPIAPKPDNSIQVVSNLTEAIAQNLLAEAARADRSKPAAESHLRLYRQIDDHWYLESQRQPLH
jgi:hypothetical protein